MSIGEIFTQLYYSGILALSIMALAIAIIVYPTLRNKSQKKR